ncbi:ferrous iron transport protein B [Scatolibacter rhodanostii]|uniref:ferrous iron transport protein B n=1 Tax=Scatolibacter rhodanostii TaxID=2014781 RepID=UPI000C06C209|nr:ferrous iron transport protein B [Scatolibacter rhodanostii]
MSIKIALAGNPNCGKTTMFNELTGSTQYVGNWPGVTVEKKEGKLKGHKDVIITDLPGIYSLSPYTMEEVISRNYLLHEAPDAIINLIDGTNLERNLYLTTQLLEIGLPMVVAVNMMDLVRKNGDKIDMKKLSNQLGCPIVETSALKGQGVKEVAEMAISAAKEKKAISAVSFSAEIEKVLAEINSTFAGKFSKGNQKWYAVKLFERDEKILEELKFSESDKKQLHTIVAAVEDELEDDSESIITNERYNWIGHAIKGCYVKKKQKMTTSDKIDRIVTSRILGLPIFVVVMSLVYIVAVSTVGSLVTDFTNDTLFGEWIQPGAESLLVAVGAQDWLVSLVVSGIIGGVGAILGFVPQMIVLFLLLSVLEDCGYMARVAFIMDRIFRKFGLSGKSFIPMLIGSGCGVPGIMATRTIENEKDRRMTIITTTFIPCGAKMPIIALIMGAAFGTEMSTWWVTPIFYFMGVVCIVIAGIILKKTKWFAGDPAPFVMELPQYHVPFWKNVGFHTWERAKSFIIKAGTIIFLSSVVVWFLSSFGWVDGKFVGYISDEFMDDSILAKIGNGIAWIFGPLGFGTWQATVGTIMGLVAKENVISTFGVLFGLGGEIGEDDAGLWNQFAIMLPHIHQQIAFLAFNLLCAPCFAAIGAIRREMNSLKWTSFALVFQTVFAYLIALMINQFGALLTGGGFGVGTVAAFLILIVMVYLLVRPDPNKRKLNTVAAANL